MMEYWVPIWQEYVPFRLRRFTKVIILLSFQFLYTQAIVSESASAVGGVTCDVAGRAVTTHCPALSTTKSPTCARSINQRASAFKHKMFDLVSFQVHISIFFVTINRPYIWPPGPSRPYGKSASANDVSVTSPKIVTWWLKEQLKCKSIVWVVRSNINAWN